MKVMKTTALPLVKNMERTIIYKMTENSDLKLIQATNSDYECLQLNASNHKTNSGHCEKLIFLQSTIFKQNSEATFCSKQFYKFSFLSFEMGNRVINI